jgi:hypothetical protein
MTPADLQHLHERLEALHRRVTKLESRPAGAAPSASEESEPLPGGVGDSQASPPLASETQETINAWAERMFGEPGSDWRCVARLLEEVAELVVELSPQAESPKRKIKILGECADCWIVLCRLATRRSVDIIEAEASLGQPTFLPGASAQDYGAVAVKMTWQLLVAVATHAPGVSQTIGRLSVTLRNLCYLHGSNLTSEVNCKMAVNRQRKWAVTADGHSYHVKHVASVSSDEYMER